MASGSSIPQEILIVGAGVFGLSTALTLLGRQAYDDSRITIIDSAAILPNPVGSSVDASRIIRADYANLSYAKLAVLAQEYWRDQSSSGWGGEGRYSETGFVLTGDEGQEAYVRESMHNVQDLAKAGLPMNLSKIQELKTRDEIRVASKLPGSSGDTGYANWNSGWADAGASVAFAIRKIQNHPNNRGRLVLKPGHQVARLQFSETTGQCTGVSCTNGTTFDADLIIFATGAWTPSLINLQNRALATGQVLGYIKITEEEQRYLENTPVVINFARGTFVIPPQRQELKIARHGFGYRNPLTVSHSSTKSNAERLSKHAVSVPRTDTQIPVEAEKALRDALAELFPPDLDSAALPPGCPKSICTVSSRPFVNTRLCWYTDTPTGNFLIDWPPLPSSAKSNTSLFIATGGSGHGFKFFPVLGDYIVDAIEGHLDPEYLDLWTWPRDEQLRKDHGLGGSLDGSERAVDSAPGSEGLHAFLECKDGSRGGPRGMILSEELDKGTAVAKPEQRVKSML